MLGRLGGSVRMGCRIVGAAEGVGSIVVAWGGRMGPVRRKGYWVLDPSEKGAEVNLPCPSGSPASTVVAAVASSDGVAGVGVVAAGAFGSFLCRKGLHPFPS